ncbi:MAG: hydrogenase small subunit [Campylobacterota bacterium]|nr:hydrogenase small subunit [Campylobacterota bacterium]
MRIVIVGGGIAAVYTANAIMELKRDAEVVIVSGEKYAPYDRIHLCALVDGSEDVDGVTLELDPAVKVELDQEITSIDRDAKRIYSEHAMFAYDKLIITTGSKPGELFDISGIENATTFRSADDSFKIAKSIKDKNVIIMGVGPIGLELLDTLMKMPDAKGIYLLSRGPHLYSKDLNPASIALIQGIFEADPRITISFNDEIVDKETEGSQITTVSTKKHTIDDPFIIFGVGISPNVGFAASSVEVNKGVLVDDTMCSSDPDIYAVGESAEIRSSGYVAGRVKECTLQANVAVANILKTEELSIKEEAAIDGLKVGSFLFTDVSSPNYDVRSEDNEHIVLYSKKENRIDQYIINSDRLVRFIGINSNIDAIQLKKMIENDEEVDAAYFYQNRLISERGRIVCSCESVFEQDLVDLIKENAVTSFGELKGLSEAGRTCGRCKKDISDIIAATPVDPEEAARIKAEKIAARDAAELAKVQKRIDKFNKLHPANQIDASNLEEAINSFDMNQEYNRWVSMITASMRLPHRYEGVVKCGIQNLNKIPIVWLELSDCTGNSEGFIKSAHPKVDDLILKYISLDYHDLLMAAAGDQSESVLEGIIENDKGKYILMVEGAVPLGMDGKFLRIGPKGETGEELLKRVAKDAAAVLAVGTCALDGGVVAAEPNPTGAVGVAEALGRDDIINLPGCPVNPINIVGTLLHYIMFDELPALDAKNRPEWAYSFRVHDNCERRGHYDMDEFVLEWGDEGAKKGWCLFEMGCKGPYADLNCSLVKFNEGTSWPVQVGHGCFACGEGKIAFDHYANNRKLEVEPDEK